MKILFTRNIDHDQVYKQDYLCDCVFHGLRNLYGETVVDSPRLWYMYKDEFGPNKLDLKSTVYGKGFSIFATLDDDSNIDRNDIEQKIKSRYYDVIVIARIDHGTPYLNLILENYRQNEIIILDGKDPSDVHSNFIGKGIYFKRELHNPNINVFPISFGFPKEKILYSSNKNRIFSFIDPRDLNTYVYNSEQEYYADYNRSLFGITMCKAGWDCMRHYEIMACRSVPFFLDIDNCPEKVCTTLPKQILSEVLHISNKNGFEWYNTKDGFDYYLEVENKIHNHFVNTCTTEKLAEYVLSKL